MMKGSLNKLKNLSFGSRLVTFKFADNFKDKEAADEKVFVSKLERDTLKNLLSKIKNKQDADQENSDINALKEVFKKHNVVGSENLITEILDWKENHH